MKDWEVIATNLSRERWDWRCIPSIDEKGRSIFVVDAQRDGKRFIVCADEKLSAFLELKSAIRGCRDFLDTQARFLQNSRRQTDLESGGRLFPRPF